MSVSTGNPTPRQGVLGVVDSFIGPNPTSAELWIQFLPPAIFTFLLCYRALRLSFVSGPLHLILYAVLVVDIWGGVLTNVTQSCKKWYHRDGMSAIDHLGFVSVHLVHVALVSLFFRGWSALYFIELGGWLLCAAGIVLSAPLYLKRVVAMLMFMIAYFLDSYVWGPTPGLEWFVPFLFLKVCFGHLVPEKSYPVDLAEEAEGEGEMLIPSTST